MIFVVPAATIVAVLPDIVTTPVFELLYETVRPELAVAVNANGAFASVLSANALKVIVWFAFEIVKVPAT